jgi:hypothetical protein
MGKAKCKQKRVIEVKTEKIAKMMMTEEEETGPTHCFLFLPGFYRFFTFDSLVGEGNFLFSQISIAV